MRRLVPVLLVLLGLPHPATAGWVIGAYFGSAVTARADLALTLPAAPPIRFAATDYEGRSFQLPPYYGYRAAYFLPSPGWFGIEGEAIHMKVYAQLPPGAILQRFSLSHGQNMLLVNAVFRHVFGECGDVRTARLVGALRVGVGPTLPHVESTVSGVPDEHYQRGAAAFQASGGVELRVWKNLHALAEYKFTRCRQSVDVASGGHVETLLSSHHVAFGASWHF